jgi:hypothetical protein
VSHLSLLTLLIKPKNCIEIREFKKGSGVLFWWSEEGTTAKFFYYFPVTKIPANCYLVKKIVAHAYITQYFKRIQKQIVVSFEFG